MTLSENARSLLRQASDNLVQATTLRSRDKYDALIQNRWKQGRLAVLQTRTFVDFIKRNPLLSRAATESVDEFKTTESQVLGSRENLLRKMLSELADAGIFPAKKKDTNDDNDKTLSQLEPLSAISPQGTARTLELFLAEGPKDEERLESVCSRVTHALTNTTRLEPRAADDEPTDFGPLGRFVSRRLLAVRQEMPGARWLFIKKVAEGAVPEPGSIEDFWSTLHDVHVHDDMLPLRLLFEHSREDNDTFAVEQLLTLLRDHVATIRVDFEARLAQKASIAWAIDRYAEKTTRFRGPELRELLRKATSEKKELILARDAAAYLHDQGFAVLTEHVAGVERHDIYKPGELLVEAKVLLKAGGLQAAMVKGLKQIYGYLASLGGDPRPDAALLLYRLAGAPPVDLPREFSMVEGGTPVFLFYVNLADSTVSGSNTPAVATVDVPAIRDRLKAELQNLQTRKRPVRSGHKKKPPIKVPIKPTRLGSR